jgi:arylsulfatase A-like enzyme
MRSHAKIPRGVAPWAAIVGFLLIGFLTPAEMARAQQAGKKPNILIIWGDDIGWYNVSAYNMGVMGYRTPNIDRIAREGAAFTDWYGQQSCTAGRAAFITGQSPIRTGLTKVGLPGAKEGLMKDDPTIADLLKPYGYATGQFGKNHLGDRDEHLPTTIVMYSTDNGAETMSWPDGGTTPFRGEKNTNWEGGYRVPCLIRWPGVIKPGTVVNDVATHEDMLPTLLAAVGDPAVKDELAKGKTVGGTTFKVHLDGYDLRPALEGQAEWPRKEFLYWTDDGHLAALRFGQWKLDFLEQRAHGFDVWQEKFDELRVPKLFTVRGDPFERADYESIGYDRWRIDHVFLLVPAQAYVASWLQSFREFPPRQRPASFSLDRVMESIAAFPRAN